MDIPETKTIQLEDIPENIKPFPCWVLWKWERSSASAPWKQIYYQPKYPTLKAHKGQPKDWSTFDITWKIYSEGGFDGIEFFEQPTTLKIIPENIPLELKNQPNWVVWKWLLDNDGNEIVWKKIPFQPHNPEKQAAATRENEWANFEDAYRVYLQGDWAGIWFSLNKLYVGIDFDHVIDTNTDRINIIREAIQKLNSFTEVSPSGTGLHCLVKGILVQGFGNKNKDNDFEIYKDARFLSVTGHILPYSTTHTIEERQDEINWFHTTYFKQKPVFKPIESNGKASFTDNQIFDKLCNSRQSDKFRKLWNGDYSDFQDTTGKPDESSADHAFCCMIAFYSSDPAQIMSMVKKSGLMRDKWERQDYASRTINHAMASTKGRYRARRNSK